MGNFNSHIGTLQSKIVNIWDENEWGERMRNGKYRRKKADSV
jgi:hypothetical protein